MGFFSHHRLALSSSIDKRWGFPTGDKIKDQRIINCFQLRVIARVAIWGFLNFKLIGDEAQSRRYRFWCVLNEGQRNRIKISGSSIEKPINGHAAQSTSLGLISNSLTKQLETQYPVLGNLCQLVSRSSVLIGVGRDREPRSINVRGD